MTRRKIETRLRGHPPLLSGQEEEEKEEPSELATRG
jgi:hypothetical protein